MIQTEVNAGMLQQEKLDQAISILNELNIDAWLVFARETEETPERSWELLTPGGVVWQSALILTPRGDRIAIVGQGDDDTYRKSGLYSDVYSFTQSIRELLREILRQINPGQLALNFSKSNPAADGLSHGMYLLLRDYLEGLPYVDRLVSADPIISRLRGCYETTPLEIYWNCCEAVQTWRIKPLSGTNPQTLSSKIWGLLSSLQNIKTKSVPKKNMETRIDIHCLQCENLNRE